MPEIKKQNEIFFLTTQRGNQLIQFANKFSQIKVVMQEGVEPQFKISDTNVTLVLPTSIIQGGGGSLPEGFEEETLDLVEDDDTTGQRVFLTKAVEGV